MVEIYKSPLHEKILSVYADGKGVNEKEGMRLAYLASCVPIGGVMVEIGSYRGQSGAYIAAGGQDAHLYMVDLWSRENLSIVSESNQYAVADTGHLRALKNNFKVLGITNYTTLQGNSAELIERWSKPIDLLFIDGDHSYEGVKADYENWAPYVKKGGFIAFHDYSASWLGVVKFIEEVAIKDLNYLGLHSRVWSGKKWQ